MTAQKHNVNVLKNPSKEKISVGFQEKELHLFKRMLPRPRLFKFKIPLALIVFIATGREQG